MKFKYTIPASGDGMLLLDSRGKMVRRPLLQIVLKGKDGKEINVIEHKVSLNRDGRTCLVN